MKRSTKLYYVIIAQTLLVVLSSMFLGGYIIRGMKALWSIVMTFILLNRIDLNTL